MGNKIPIKIARDIAEKYGYEQVIVLAMKQDEHKENWFYGWQTTYNKNKLKCKFLGKVASILSYNFKAFYSNKETTEEYFNKLPTY